MLSRASRFLPLLLFFALSACALPYYLQAARGQVGLLRQLTDDPVVLRHLRLGDGLRPSRPDGELVAVPVREPDDEDADREADDGTLAAPQQLAEDDQEPAEPGEQDEGLEGVLHGSKGSPGC